MGIHQNIKKDFPIFGYHPELVYLDSAATSLKPQSVINALDEYYSQYSVNIHRGIYVLSEKATEKYEKTRKIVAQFIGADDPSEIIFTRNSTESLNLIAYTLGHQIVSKNDEVITSVMEHHSNFVPWQVLAREKEALFKVINIDDAFQLDISEDSIEQIITKRSKILSLTHVSNVLGTINPIEKIIRLARRINPQIVIIIDATKSVPMMPIDVKTLGADFVVFSLHKMLGPTGVGVLWGRRELLNEMPPFLYGGGMIREVSLDHTTYKDTPHKFEAGTPAIAEVIAAGFAIEYLEKLGMDNVYAHEKELAQYTMKRLREEFGNDINFYGPAVHEDRAGIVSFTFDAIHPHDIAQILDESHIAIRGGHHCTMPLHTRLQISASARASFYIYNDKEDVEKLIKGLRKVKKVLLTD